MLKNSLIFALLIGCSAPEQELGAPWAVNEEGTTDDSVLLRASENDPYYGTHTDFFAVFFGIQTDHKRCAALRIILDLRFEEDVILSLPKSITQTSQKYALEIPRFQRATWLLPRLDGGQVLAFKSTADFEPATIQLHSFPFIEPTVEHLLYCGPAPESLSALIVSPPEEVEIEVWTNGRSTVKRMKAETQWLESGLSHIYREVE